MFQFEQSAIRPVVDAILVQGDFRKNLAAFEDASVDLVVCDPPYNAKDLPSWIEELPIALARVMKPGAYAAICTGHMFLERIMASFCSSLKYQVLVSLYHRKPRKESRLSFDLLACTVPVLIVTNGKPRPDIRPAIPHLIYSEFRRGEWIHPWQKSELSMRELVSILSRPGELVADPMCGFGTTVVAALQCGRRSIGCELLPERFGISCRRAASVSGKLIEGRSPSGIYYSRHPLPWEVPALGSVRSVVPASVGAPGGGENTLVLPRGVGIPGSR
jgi:site-specific DNA-methyltransferase (adenine-specific)